MNTNKQLTKGNKMKKAIMMISLISVIGLNLNTAANALVLVNGYFKSNGTYVGSHYRTNPDGVCYNNFSGC
ncbi:hypothetical protein OAX12_02405 [Candidatus Pelagibacter sp.]|jgi:hypothetical protein|nr:hypothetical protein [Candidatus Pelagibacter sp.]